eukprot:scaffold876_cov243-Pinguiococcus_pyrenoidosus.AAC.38
MVLTSERIVKIACRMCSSEFSSARLAKFDPPGPADRRPTPGTVASVLKIDARPPRRPAAGPTDGSC